jgi:hypothetical protein
MDIINYAVFGAIKLSLTPNPSPRGEGNLKGEGE